VEELLNDSLCDRFRATSSKNQNFSHCGAVVKMEKQKKSHSSERDVETEKSVTPSNPPRVELPLVQLSASLVEHPPFLERRLWACA